MPMALLEELAEVNFPFEVADPEDVDKLRVLLAAGHIDAVIPPVAHDQSRRPAIVLEITPLGRKALRFFGSPSRHWGPPAAPPGTAYLVDP